jgi:hypothetical protein
LCVLLWSKTLNAKDIHKEMFPAYGEWSLSRKGAQKCVEKRGKLFAYDEGFEMELPKWLRQQSKDFYAAFFDALL